MLNQGMKKINAEFVQTRALSQKCGNHILKHRLEAE